MDDLALDVLTLDVLALEDLAADALVDEDLTGLADDLTDEVDAVALALDVLALDVLPLDVLAIDGFADGAVARLVLGDDTREVVFLAFDLGDMGRRTP